MARLESVMGELPAGPLSVPFFFGFPFFLALLTPFFFSYSGSERGDDLPLREGGREGGGPMDGGI